MNNKDQETGDREFELSLVPRNKVTDMFFNIRNWARNRELEKADPIKQLAKLMEETGELAEGLLKDREGQIIDSIGDIVVVLTILSMQINLNIEECILMAYEEIKDRKGKTVNGVYIKAEDLEEVKDE